MSNDVPWELSGRLLTPSLLDLLAQLPLHHAICATYSLRLSVLFDAPVKTQRQMLDDSWSLFHVGAGIVYSAEFAFVSAIILIRSDPNDHRLQICYDDLERLARSCECINLTKLNLAPNYKLKLKFLRQLAKLRPPTLETVMEVEDFVYKLEEQGEFVLYALFNLYLAKTFGTSRHGQKLAMGYIFASFDGFKKGEMEVVCHSMREKYPFCPSPPDTLLYPDVDAPTAQVVPAPVSAEDETSTATAAKEHKFREAERLDALT